MGLGLPEIAASGATPWFIALANQGKLASNVFSFFLTHDGAKGSELCVGCIDSSKFSGDPEYFPAIQGQNGTLRFWAIQSAGIFHNDVAITPPLQAIIDSGNTGIVLSDSNTAAFYAQVPGAKLESPGFVWTFPCASASSIPSLSVKFTSDTVYSLAAEDLSLGPMEKGSETCVGAIYSLGMPDDVLILGDAFMKRRYSIFDYGNMRVGFAPVIN